MKLGYACLLTIAIALLSIRLAAATGWASLPWFVIFASALWVGFDAHRIRLQRYDTLVSHHPVTVFVAAFLFWVIVFPFYLDARHRIVTGKALLKA